MLLNLSGEDLVTLRDYRITEVLSRLNVTAEDITELDVSSCGLTTLEGLERFVNLQMLDASDNDIATLAPLWGLRKLQVLKLRRNYIGSICVRVIGRATVIATEKDIEQPASMVDNVHYKLLDLEDNKIDSIRAEPFTSIEVECLLLPNNHIVDISGLGAFCGVNTVDFTGNVHIDASALLFMGYKPGLRVFLQGCEISNQESLLALLHRDPDAEIIAPGEVTFDHPRMVKINTLDLKRLCEKQFVNFGSEFADFTYAGDDAPCELKTTRESDSRSMCPLNFNVGTGSRQVNRTHTIAVTLDVTGRSTEAHRALGNIKMCSTIGSYSETVTPMSINTTEGEESMNTATPSARSLMTDGTADEIDSIKRSCMKDVIANSAKISPASWVESAREELYS